MMLRHAFSKHAQLIRRRLVWEELQGRAKDRAAAEAKKAKESRDALAFLIRYLHCS